MAGFRLFAIASVIAGALLCVPKGASAQDNEKDAKAHLKEAAAAFEAGRFADAETSIKAGLDLEPKNHSLLRLRGEVRLALRDFEGALSAYEEYLAAKPRGANRRKARKIIANLAATRTTGLEIDVGAGPADIFLDSKALGVYCVADPKCKRGMLPGRYRVIATRKGFSEAAADVRVKLGEVEVVKLELAELPSALQITTTPTDATITVDGKPYDANATIAAGEHAVSVTLEGFVTVEKTFTAAKGELITLDVQLPELVAVSANVEGAAFTLDGNSVTPTDGKIAVPTDGASHEIVATAEGYEEAKVTLAADRKRGDAVTLELEKIEVPVVTPPVVVNEGKQWSRGRSVLFGSLLGLGVIGFGVGSIAGLTARSEWNDVNDRCPMTECDQEGVDQVDTARGRANLSNLAFGIGIAALAGAGVVWFTVPKESSTTPSVSAVVTPKQVGMTVRVGF